MRMALAQKEKMKQKTQDSGVRSFSAGGFVGINQLKKGAPVWTPGKKRKDQQKDNIPENQPAAQSENELFILGLLKEQHQQQVHNKDKVSEGVLPVQVTPPIDKSLNDDFSRQTI